MKSILHSIARRHHFQFAAVVSGLIGWSAAMAQSGTASGSADSRQEQRKATQSAASSAASQGKSGGPNPATAPTTATGSGYHSGVASADADATREINAQNARKLPVERLTTADRRFLVKASDAGFSELQAAQLAAERAADPKVREFAQKLVREHSTASTALVTLGNQKGLLIEKDPSTSRSFNRLKAKKGASFDQEFLDYIADAHEDTIKLYEKAAASANDLEVKAFAASHVAALREHLQATQALQSGLAGSGSAAPKR